MRSAGRRFQSSGGISRVSSAAISSIGTTAPSAPRFFPVQRAGAACRFRLRDERFIVWLYNHSFSSRANRHSVMVLLTLGLGVTIAIFAPVAACAQQTSLARPNPPAIDLPGPQPTSGGLPRVGRPLITPRLISRVKPEYTAEARKARAKGVVTFYAVVGPDGKLRNIRLVRGLGYGLDEKAIEAVRQWRFKPGTKDGKPVLVPAMIEVRFPP